MMTKDRSSFPSVFIGGFDRNMLMKEQQHKKQQAEVEAKEIGETKVEEPGVILKKHQQVSEKEQVENIFRCQKEDQHKTNKFHLFNKLDDTNSNQNKIVLATAKDSEQSQNMLLGCRGQNRRVISRSNFKSQTKSRNESNRINISNGNKNQDEEITLNALVNKKRFEKAKQYWFAIGSILLFALLISCFHQQTGSNLVEAKIHHSKRQAPDQSSFSSSAATSNSLTGRENTNWWNLWWQQYISDAIQPTVRPIVSVSFNGKTISLPDQTPESADSNNIAQFQPESRDVDTNFVLQNLNSPEMNPIDLERNEKLRLISSNLPDNTHPFAAKQMMLAQRKSIQQQTNWQSVKPTIIQMEAHQPREARPNRQADLNQVEDTSVGQSSAPELGIQMRTSMSQRRKDQPQQQLVPKPSNGQQQVIRQTNSLPNSDRQPQQLREDDVRFEQQQQNQMVDYSEESEPEMENNTSNNATSGMEGDDQGRAGQQSTGAPMSGEGLAANSVGSSSSSMTLGERPKESGQRPVAGDEINGTALNERARQQQRQGSVTQTDSIKTKTQSDDKTTNGPNESQRASELSQSGAELSTVSPSTTARMSFLTVTGLANDTTTTATTRKQPQPTTSQRQPVSKAQQSGTMATTTPVTQRPSSSSKMSDTRDGASLGTSITATPLTSTAAPSTSTSARFVPTADDNVDVNETPISIMTETETETETGTGTEQPTKAQSREQQASKSTTPTGRVELQNGRPATGGRQMATTTSARLPTKPSSSSTASRATSQRGSSTTPAMSTTPVPTSIAQEARQGDSSAQPGMKITSASSTTLRPREGTDSVSTAVTLMNNAPTQSPSPSPSPNPNQTTETTTSAGSSSEATDSPGSEGSEDSDDDEEETSTNSSADDVKQSSGNSTASNDSSSADSDDSTDDSSTSTSSDSENENQQEQTTTVSTPTITTSTPATPATQSQATQTTTAGGPTSSPFRSQTQAEQRVTTTTQQPALTTIDIERLPAKGGSKPGMPGSNMVMMRTSTAPSTSSSSTPADISRITRPSSGASSPSTVPSTVTSTAATSPQTNQQQQRQQNQMPSANLIMMNLDQTRPGTIDGETAITMPIDTLMKMMMMNQIMRENNELRSSTMPVTTLDQTTQTPMTKSSDISSSTYKSFETTSSQTTPAQSTSAPASERPETNSETAAKKFEDENSVSQGSDTGIGGVFKKKLQPPPTTRQPSPSNMQSGGRSATETGQTIAMQTTITSPFTTSTPVATTPSSSSTTTTTSPTTIEADGPTQKTMFVNFEPSSDSMMDMTSGGRAEPKIDLINLDLLPIQRIMNSQTNRVSDKLGSNGTAQKSGTQPLLEQQGVDEFMRGPQTPMQKMDQLMLEVEPGMRLRPPIGMAGVVMRGSSVGGSPTNTGQVMGSTKTGVNNPSNTIYTIMSSSSAPPPPPPVQQQQGKAHSKKPAAMLAADQRSVTPQAPVKNGASTPTMSTRITSQTQKEIADMMMMMMMRKNEPTSDKQDTSTRLDSGPDFGAVSTATTTTTESPSGFETEQQIRSNATTIATPLSTSTRGSTTLRPSSTSNATSTPRRTLKQEVSSSVMPNLTNTTMARTASPIATTTATSVASISRETATEPESKSTKETNNTPSSTQAPAKNQQQQMDGSQNSSLDNNINNNRFDRIQQQPPETRRPQQVGIKTGKLNQLQVSSKASNSNLTSSFIPQKLRTNFNKFTSSRVQAQQAVRMNERLVVQPQKDAAESVRQSSTASVEPMARVSQPTTTTQSPSLANSMIQNMAIRQFGGANRMSALANQPVPFGRPSAMTIQQATNKQRFELPSFEYGPSIAVRRPDEPLANGQIPNCTLTGKNFCVLTKDYPMNEVRQAVERSFRSVRIMYEELQTVSDQELHKEDFNLTNNQAASGKFACQTQVEMMRPGWAKDEITREWMLVVNTDVFPQRVRTESCAQPNTPCEFIAPFYDSTCQQRYSLHRMIAIDPHDPTRSPQVAVFKFPAGCVCRVHPIRKTTTATMLAQTTLATPSPVTVISSSTSKSIRRRR